MIVIADFLFKQITQCLVILHTSPWRHLPECDNKKSNSSFATTILRWSLLSNTNITACAVLKGNYMKKIVLQVFVIVINACFSIWQNPLGQVVRKPI